MQNAAPVDQPPEGRSQKTRTLRLALFTVAAAACSTGDWEAPPPTRDDAKNLELVGKLADVMEERGLFEVEVDDAAGGVRIRVDRRAGGGGPVFVASGGPAPEPSDAAPARSGTSGGAKPGGKVAGDDAAGEADPASAAADVFHPANQPGPDGELPPAPAPRYGGRVIVHLSTLPKHLNYVTENSGDTRRILYEIHESLLLQDWEQHDYKPRLAKSYTLEDMVVLQPGAEGDYPQAKALRVRPLGYTDPFDGYVIYGEVEELDGGGYRVSPVSNGGSALAEPVEIAAADALSAERGCVMTLQLRDNAKWQPAKVEANGKGYSITDQMLDADDVYFSWKLYFNPEVDCDEKRFQFVKMPDCEIIDPHAVRIFNQEQYYLTVDTIGTSLTILPSHLYNLADPDCPWYDPEATPSQQAQHINENPYNQEWVGLGPYQVTDWNQQWVEAKRYPDYYDPSNSGYVDTIRWRNINDDNTAWQALLNGELDYFERVKSTDYFGAATEQEVFTSNYYKGYKYLGNYGYTAWNTHRPYLSDKRVRQALAYAFPADDFLRTAYRNLARRTTGPFPYSSAAYDHSLKPYPYDLDKARRLLEEAGFFDTDGNGVVDKDGRDLVIDFMMPSGNDASKNLGLVMQENYARIGIKLVFSSLEWATFLDRMKKRDFDACNLAWIPGLESDPEQIWHSKWGQPAVEGSNNSGIREPELDALILAGQREIDFEERQEIWKQIHRFLYDWQPYLFGYNVPQKFAMTKRIRGFQTFALDPGYSIRRWYFVDPAEPGTRETR